MLTCGRASVQEPGVVAFLSAEDIPGENKVKVGASDAPLFADGKVEYVGQHLGIILARSPKQAQDAAALVEVTYSHPKVEFLGCWKLGISLLQCFVQNG